MKRRGDSNTLNKTLGILLAVVGLVVFFIGLGRLYDASRGQESENAQRTLETLTSRIEALEVGQTVNVTVQGFKNADSWYLMGWSKELNTESRPQKCFFGNCLCICKGTSKEDCQKGICRTIDNNLFFNSYSDFLQKQFEADENRGTGGSRSRYTGDEIVRRSCIPVSSTLFELEISRNVSSITLGRSFLQTESFTTLPC